MSGTDRPDSRTLRVSPVDPAVRRRTADAIIASSTVSPLDLRCTECGHTLASVGMTTIGPLFVASPTLSRGAR